MVYLICLIKKLPINLQGLSLSLFGNNLGDKYKNKKYFEDIMKYLLKKMKNLGLFFGKNDLNKDKNNMIFIG